MRFLPHLKVFEVLHVHSPHIAKVGEMRNADSAPLTAVSWTLGAGSWKLTRRAPCRTLSFRHGDGRWVKSAGCVAGPCPKGNQGAHAPNNAGAPRTEQPKKNAREGIAPVASMDSARFTSYFLLPTFRTQHSVSAFRCTASFFTARPTAMRAASTVRMPNRWAISGRLHWTSMRATIISRSFAPKRDNASR